jgi:hypothetical protein
MTEHQIIGPGALRHKTAKGAHSDTESAEQ